MSGRLGIDFGTSNTVVTLWSDVAGDSKSLSVGDFARVQEVGAQRIFVIPSLIHFGADFREIIGNQVLQRNLYHSQRTFQWMKRYICQRSPSERFVDGRNISYFEAGRRFLSGVMKAAAESIDFIDEEVGLTVPVEAYEDYSEWLASVAHEAGLIRFRLVDEPSAAAIGYGADVEPDDVYCVFDFGGGTLDVSVVVLSEIDSLGRHCRVLGKAGMDLGGTSIDEWIFQDVLKRNSVSTDNEDVRLVSRMLLVECERLKERLSFQENAELSVINPVSGKLIHAEFTRQQLEDLLDSRNAYAHIDRTIRRALKAAQERGFDDDAIKKVFLVGGGSNIPSVQTMIKRIFGKERVLMERPMDAVARGASAIVAGAGFKDFVQHEYAIRYVNPTSGKYEYRTIVRRGTAYPTLSAVATLTIKASFDGQNKLGIPLFELGNSDAGDGSRLELVFDETGAARMQTVSYSAKIGSGSFWINESSPTFLNAEPPGMKGESRFRLQFNIDGNRRLLITAYDLRKEQFVLVDYPAAKLI